MSGFTPAVALFLESRLTAPVSFLMHIYVSIWHYVAKQLVSADHVRMAAGHRRPPAHHLLRAVPSSSDATVVRNKATYLFASICCWTRSGSAALPRSSLQSAIVSRHENLAEGERPGPSAPVVTGPESPLQPSCQNRVFPRQQRAGVRGSDMNLRNCSRERRG